MKKTLLVTALLLSSQVAFGGWDKGIYYVNKGDNSFSAVGQNAEVEVMAGNVMANATTIANVTMANGQTMSIKQNKWDANGSDANLTFSELIVAPATGDEGNGKASLVIDDAQKLTINKLTGSLSKVTVNGTLTLNGNNVMGLNNFTLDADGIIKGTYNLGDTPGDVTFTLSHADAITSTLSSLKNYEKTLVDGAVWNFEKISSFTLNVGEENTNASVVYLWKGSYYSDWTAGNNVTNFDTEDLLPGLAESTAYVVVKMNNGGNGVTGMTAVITVPEPTTATLSLLALAGLAARRRRR